MSATSMREFENVSIDVAAELMEDLTDTGDNVMLWGSPGLGKTSIAHQLAARRKRKLIEFKTNIREPVDLRGVPIADRETGTTRWLSPDELPRVERDGEEGYLFLDEINTCSPQMMAVVMGLVLEKKVGEYHLPPLWRVIAAGNHVSDRAAAQQMPTALANRFAHLYCVVSIEAWAKWAAANGVPQEVIAYVKFRSGRGEEVLHKMPTGPDARNQHAFVTPRSLTAASKYVNAKRHRVRLFASHIGWADAHELDGFLQLYQSVGTLDGIVADPDGANLVVEPSVRYAVCTGLARMANRKNFPAIMKYAKRLEHRESEALIVTDAVGRDPTLKNTPIYGKWALDNTDLTVQ